MLESTAKHLDRRDVQDLLSADMSEHSPLNLNIEGVDLSGLDFSLAHFDFVRLAGANLAGTRLPRPHRISEELRDYWSLCVGIMPLRRSVLGSGWVVPTPAGWRLEMGSARGADASHLRDVATGVSPWHYRVDGSYFGRRTSQSLRDLAVRAAAQTWWDLAEQHMASRGHIIVRLAELHAPLACRS